MGLNYEEQKAKGLTLLPQIISTGLPDIIMPVACREDLQHISPDFPALTVLSKQYDVVGVHAFTLDSLQGITCHTRNFAPLYDIDEEAATGTSSGALTYYGYLNGFVKNGDACRFMQGEKMGRPSAILSKFELDCSADGCEDNLTPTCYIQVGGSGCNSWRKEKYILTKKGQHVRTLSYHAAFLLSVCKSNFFRK